MNILIVSGHPAQVHNFRCLKSEFEQVGHTVFWLATDKDISIQLLNHYNINFSLLKRPSKGIISKAITLLRNTLIALKFIRKNKIDIIISRISPYVTIGGFLLRKKHIAMTDTETAGFYDLLFSRFVSVLFTAKSFKRNLRRDQIRFNGNIELFYLHPNRFTPQNTIYKDLNIDQNAPFIIMRFVSWDAYHDKGLKGFTDENKLKAARAFSKYGKVFITSEKELTPELEPYRILIPPFKMHNALACASLFFGESSTMASESAVLGTPAIYLNENWFGSTEEEENAGLLFSFKESLDDQAKAIDKGCELLQDPSLDNRMSASREKFLNDKIDVTAFMFWFVENYPKSFQILKTNINYQYNFK